MVRDLIHTLSDHKPLVPGIPVDYLRYVVAMRTETIIIALLSLGIFCQSVPGAGAAGPADGWPMNTSPELNGSGFDLANQTLPSHYAVTPVPIRVEVRISDTLLPVAKGEMAAGPRSIGFSIEPVTLGILLILVIAVAAGAGYLMKKKLN